MIAPTLGGAEIMTDKQWDGMLTMVIKIIEKCEDKEEALRELYDLVRKEPPAKDKKEEQSRLG